MVLGWFIGGVLAADPAPRMEIDASATNGWPRLRSSVHPDRLLTLEATTNFAAWEPIATLHDAARNYPDAAALRFDRRFYRLLETPRTATNDWKNELPYLDEPFLSAGEREVRWVKFAIPLADPTRVFYQDSDKFPFHFDFASQRLEPFVGWNRAAFDAVSLRRTNQQVVLGTVLFPPGTNFVEYGVQFVGLDPYPPEDIARWFELVKATVHAEHGAGAFYMPVFEQTEMARTNAAAFAARNIAVASTERWGAANHVYAPGWALGRLKYFPAGEIVAAFADGRLRPEDILLTDGVPAETPLVAGILSLTPSTPNSHTAILAQSFGIPFAHLPDEAERTRVQAWVGRKVIVRATTLFGRGETKVLDVEGALDPALEAQLLALKQAEPISYRPKQTRGSFSASTDDLSPADIVFFGGKAANFGMLRDAIPTNSPPAIAFSFDLWDAFLDQPWSGAPSLRAAIQARLAEHTQYPPNMPALLEDLAVIRGWIEDDAVFAPALRQAVTNALTVFDPERKIRFRSSTNVEDAESFSGAGLYDSYSGCLLDDLDGDTAGPSLCDPSEPKERGVFRAIQKVYASFYNDQAFLERLRRDVDESEVGMGVLVHHSFPDEVELANGVATLRYNVSPFHTSYQGQVVSQLGAESVTNPDGTAVPEVVEIYGFGASADLTLTRRSSRVPLGAHVMQWDADYRGFLGLFNAVATRFHQLNPTRSTFTLDFEYKKDVALGLVVKQVREVPNPATTNATVPFLIDEPTEWRVAQMEAGDVFSNHRLKSLWTLRTRSLRLSGTNLAAGIHLEGTLQYLSNGTIQTLSGPLSGWPNASNSVSGSLDHWTTEAGAAQRRWTLETLIETNVTGATPPIFTQQDFTHRLHVAYATPVPALDYQGEPIVVTNEFVVLEPVAPVPPGSLLQHRVATNKTGVRIETRFYWPESDGESVGGYTAPLLRFVETRIEGLTSQPLTLTNYFSQTHRPGHHNFTEEYLFEPRLEPGLSPTTLTELEAANIRLIYLELGFGPSPKIVALGADGVFREL